MSMNMGKKSVTNVVFVGLGGQGVICVSDILADAMFHGGWDVKKAEVHGMSQRGGVVTTDVRFGRDVLSPMVPPGEADFVVLLSLESLPRATPLIRPNTGRILDTSAIEVDRLPHRRCLNVALLGALAEHLSQATGAWEAAIRRAFRPALHDVNLMAFSLGRRARRVA